jgi:hypothetical protein
MLFRDQCVAKGTMIPMSETETEVVFQGYKVEVNGSPVTEMRVFRNKTAQQFEIGIDNCLEFAFDIRNSLSAILSMTDKLTIGSATINAAVRIFDVTVNKETGAVTESSLGTYPFNNIIDGYFANFAPTFQAANDPVILSCNYFQNGVYHLPPSAMAIITTYGDVFLTCVGTGGFPYEGSASGYTVWNLNNILLDVEGDISIFGGGRLMIKFRLTRTELIDGSNSKINGGRVATDSSRNSEKICEDQKAWSDLFQEEDGPSSGGASGSGSNTGSIYYSSVFNNILFENIRGGLDSCVAVNVSGMSASANRSRVILERKTWQPTSVGNPSVSSVDPKSYKFAKHYGRAQGFITKQYEFFTGTVNDLFLTSMSTCRRAFIVGGGSDHVDSMIQGYIDGVSASHEEFQDGYKAWRVSFSFVQEIGLEN